jgi:hypothetical protein
VGRLRSLVNKLRRDAKGEFDSFTLVKGSTYRYDRMEAMRQLYLYGCDMELGLDPDEPEVWTMLLQARDPESVLLRFRASNPTSAFVNLDGLYYKQAEGA